MPTFDQRHAHRRPAIDRLEGRRLLAIVAGELPALYVNAGGPTYVDGNGRTFVNRDAAFTGGQPFSLALSTSIGGTLDDTLFRTGLVGSDIRFDVNVPDGNYALFVEFASIDPADEAGANVFDVFAEGVSVVDDVDPFVIGGGAAHVAGAVHADVTVDDGALNVQLLAGQGEAIVSAIALVPRDTPADVAPYDRDNSSEVSRSVTAMSFARAFIQGVHLYMLNNRGRLPADLATLLRDDYVEPAFAVSPRSATGLVRGVMNAIERSAWATNADDYLYVGAGLTWRDLDASTPLIYENPTSTAGDLAVAFGDGHVELVPRATAGEWFDFDPNVAPTNAAPPPQTLPVDPLVQASRENLRIIDEALRHYADGNRGKLPTSLGKLSVSGTNNPLTLATFFDPREPGQTVPPESASWTVEQKAAWIDANSDYVLLGAGQATYANDLRLYAKPLAPGAPYLVSYSTGEVRMLEHRWGDELIAANTAPVVTAMSYDVDANAVVVTYSEPVALDETPWNDVRLTRDGETYVDADAMRTLNSDGRTVTTRFAALPDGNYQAVTHWATVRDEHDRYTSGSTTIGFAALVGDLDGDRVVGFDDLLTLAQRYGTSGATYSQGNLNRDEAGLIDMDDLLVLARQYGKSIAGPIVTLGTNQSTTVRRRATDLTTI